MADKTYGVELRIKGGNSIKELSGVERGVGKVEDATRRLAAQQEKQAQKAAAAAQKTAAAERAAAAQKVAAAQKAAAAQQKALTQQQKAADKTASGVAKAADRAAKAQQKASEAAAHAAEKAEKDQERAADRLALHWQRIAERSRAVRERAEVAATNAAAREAAKQEQIAQRSAAARDKSRRDSLRKAGGVFATVSGFAVAGAVSAADRARGIAGVQDLPTRVRTANEMKASLVTTAADAGLSREESDALQENVQKSALRSATMPEDIMAGLSIAHDKFNGLREFSAIIDDVSLAAKAADTQMNDMIGMLGSAKTAYGLNAEELRQAMAIALGAASKGAIRPKDFADQSIASQMGIHALNTGQTGLEGFRQFVGLIQTVGAGQFGVGETATRASQAISYLNRGQVADDLEAIGVKVRNDEGKIDIAPVIDQLMSNEKFQTPRQQQAIFKDVQAREGIMTLMNQRRKVQAGEAGAVDFDMMSHVSVKTGVDSVNEKFDRLKDAGLIDLQRQAVEMQNDTIDNLKKYNEQILAVTQATNLFEKSLGSTLGLWGPSIASAGAGALASWASVKLLLAGAAPAAEAAVATAAEVAATTAGGTGAVAGAGLLGTLGLGTLGAGLFGGGIYALSSYLAENSDLAGTLSAHKPAVDAATASLGLQSLGATSEGGDGVSAQQHYSEDSLANAMALSGDMLDVRLEELATKLQSPADAAPFPIHIETTLFDNRTVSRVVQAGTKPGSVSVGAGPALRGSQ